MKDEADSAGAWIPRLDLAGMAPELSGYLQSRVRRLGYLGEWFRCAAHSPKPLLAFLQFTDELKDALPMKVSETVVLTVATELGNSYERNQHERLCIRSGLHRDWVAQVEERVPDGAQLLSADERAVQRYTLAALRRDRDDTRRHFAALAVHFTPAEAMAIVLLVGRYWTHALGVDTLGLAPPVPSIFEDGFNG